MPKNALYAFAIVRGDTYEPLDMQGLDGEPVDTLAHKGLVALVQRCKPRLFLSGDHALFASWVLTHQKIIDTAWTRSGAVIPCCFNMIISAGNSKTARQRVVDWLDAEGESLLATLERLRDKAEYAVQVVWDPSRVARQIWERDTQIKQYESEILSKPSGVGYFLKKEMEELIQKRSASRGEGYFRTFYRRIRDCVEDVRVERLRPEPPPNEMLLNLSCLQRNGQTDDLGAVLEGIAQTPGFDVRFTGPWPPYSFVRG